MEKVDKRSKKERKNPRVPIKTYKWEDVRRSRRRGGYPWTHLYKEPFYETLDPEPYTMDGMRKAKSSSTMGKSDDFEISEVSTFDNQSSYMVEDIEIPNIEIKDPQNHSIKTSCSSLILDEEQCDDSDVKEEEDIKETNGVDDVNIAQTKEHLSPGMFFLHSEESLDNISQYLDREERGPSVKPEKPTENVTPPQEEGTSRKRKLSIESSRSKVSLGKQAILQKLKDTKEKIKIPKIRFPTKLKKPAKKQKHSPPPEPKKAAHKSSPSPRAEVKPVYIHIPLKPPPGETDQFSHLENETEAEKKVAKKPASFRDLVKNLKQLQEPKIDHKLPSPIQEVTEEEVFDDNNKKVEKTEVEQIPSISNTSINEEVKEEVVEESVSETNQTKETDKPEVETIEKIEDTKESKLEDDIEIIEEIEEPIHSDSQDEKTPDTLPPDNDFFEKLFEASASRPRTDSQNFGRPIRSKSAEPERKRKLSLESSYSRKSLSKLGLLKRLRDAKDKIKNKLSRVTSKKDVNVIKEPEKPIVEKPVKVEKSKQLKPQKNIEPVYIHIPLKPPEGTTDEYSHLKNESKPTLERTETVSSTPESPVELPGNVQFIILTAPSDDEILDYNSSDVPETPSSENKLFFPSKIHELKELAKGAVDEVTGSTTKLASVSEEPGNLKVSTEDITEKIQEEVNVEKKIEKSCVEDVIQKVLEEERKLEEQRIEHMTVDEEDGLSESKIEEIVLNLEEAKTKIEGKQVPETNTEPETRIEQESAEIEAKINKDEETTPDIVEETKKEDANAPISMETDEVLDLEEAEIEPEEHKELKSVLKTPNSPVMKKKVSFKRKVKSKNDGYEDINIPTEKIETEDDANAEGLDKFQSIPVDEEDVYMEEKIINDNSLDDKRNRWSKISDHEYEPVNPPPDNIEFIPTVTLNSSPVCIIDTAQALDAPEPLTFNITKTLKANDSPKLQKDKSPKTQRVAFSSVTESRSSESDQKAKEGPSKLQAAFRQKADNFKNKLQNIKRPHINLPNRPKFQKPNLQRFKIERKFSLPKLPDGAKINLPSFSLPHRQTKQSVKRVSSTESNAGDSRKPKFDFSTYPRIFKKKPKQPTSDFATVPRQKKPDSRSTEDSRDSRISATDSIRIPLHSEESEEKEDYNADIREVPSDTSDTRQPSHFRYDEGIDSEDEYDQKQKELIEERDFLSRWQRGRFNPDEIIEEPKPNTKITDLDLPEEKGYEFAPSNGKEQRYSSGSSLGVHRQGVIEEINPDEFFLRQKGISQDNIEVGLYLSTEIREAFRNPTNALLQMEENNNFDVKGSHTSLPEMPNKKKSIKKPKRKKTPHASTEKIPYGEDETADEETDTLPPSRPRRRSKRKKKTNEEFIPYQETIQVDSTEERIAQHRESIDIFADDEREMMYENEIMEGKDQPQIQITDPYRNYGYDEEDFEEEDEIIEEYIPEAPPRKPKTVKSLNLYENDSIPRKNLKMHQAFFERRVTEPNIITYQTDVVVPERKSFHMNISESKITNIEDIEPDTSNINTGDSYGGYYMDEDVNTEDILPAAPPRKQKSLKSLNISENDSLPGSLGINRAIFSSEKNLEEPEIDAIRTESKIIIPIEPEPKVPKRPSRSRSRGNSRTTSRNTSQKDLDRLSFHEDYPADDIVPYTEETRFIQDINDYIIPAEPDSKPPKRPARSRSGGNSRTTSRNTSQRDLDRLSLHEVYPDDDLVRYREEQSILQGINDYIIPDDNPPKRPARSRSGGDSRTASESRTASQRDLDSVSFQDECLAVEELVPCVEEPCVQQVCDYMGYSVVDKAKVKDPPLPPPRSLKRKKRSTKKDQENKFFTVPRTKSKETEEETPVRPLRNYSTLGQTRLSVTPDIVEDKENIDILQYIEIDDEPNRNLQSGEVIEKMKARPLPAPPRPPRKGKPLQDITSRENIMLNSTEELHKEATGETYTQTEPLPDDFVCEEPTGETEVYTQTEPLPDDFVCEEVTQEPTDKVIIPSQTSEAPRVEKRLITPTTYSYEEETITHGSLVVEPLNGAKILPDSDISERRNERIVPIRVDDDYDETSSIPEDFHKLRDPKGSKQPQTGELDVLKAQKLQVTDLDVETLTVNKLLASKIVVSEIDSSSIQTNEISSKTGALSVGEITLPPEVINQIIKTIQSQQPAEEESKDDTIDKKKTSIKFCSVDSASQYECNVESPLEVPETLSIVASTETIPVDDVHNIQEIISEIDDKEICPESSLEAISHSEIAPPIQNEQIKSKEINLEEDIVPDESPPEQSRITEIIEEPSDEASKDISPISTLPEEIPPTVPPRAVSQDAKVDIIPDKSPPEQSLLAEIAEQEILSDEASKDIVSITPEEIAPIVPPRVISHDAKVDIVPGNSPPEEIVEEPSKEQEPFPTISASSEEIPPTVPPRAVSHDSKSTESALEQAAAPHRPPRLKPSQSTNEESVQEPEVDDEPPPRPPQPPMGYIPSQPPASFYALRAQKYVDDNIPVVPRRRRQAAKSKPLTRSSSEESSEVSHVVRRHHRRSSDPSIGQLSGQLVRACGSQANTQLTRLISYLLNNVVRNEDGKQDLNVMIVLMLVLIAGLLLLGYGEERTVIHLHHWEYFNPPKNS